MKFLLVGGNGFMGNNLAGRLLENGHAVRIYDRGPNKFRVLPQGAEAGDETVRQCVETTSFERVTNRKRGEEQSSAFLRKGVAGDWREVFTERDKEIFKEVAGDFLIRLGYKEDNNW